MTINYLTTDSSKLRHLITRRSPATETQQPIDHKWSVKPILRSIQIYAGIALRFDRKSDLRRAMKPGPGDYDFRACARARGFRGSTFSVGRIRFAVCAERSRDKTCVF